MLNMLKYKTIDLIFVYRYICRKMQHNWFTSSWSLHILYFCSSGFYSRCKFNVYSRRAYTFIFFFSMALKTDIVHLYCVLNDLNLL